MRLSFYYSKNNSIHCSYYCYNVPPLPHGNFFKCALECFDLAPIVLDIYFPCCLYLKLLQLILYIFCLRPGVSFFSRRNQHFLLVLFSGNAFKDYNLGTRVIPWYRLAFHFWAFLWEIMYFLKCKIYFEFILILPIKTQDFRIFYLICEYIANFFFSVWNLFPFFFSYFAHVAVLSYVVK